MLGRAVGFFAEAIRTVRNGGARAHADHVERQRRIVLSAATDLIARSISIVVYFVTVRLTLGYLGTERFGLFATLCSFVAMFSFADLGIGNGLLGFVARSQGKDDVAAVREYISTALVVLWSLTVFVLIVLGVSYSLTPWGAIFKLATPAAIAEAGPATAALVCCVAVAIPLAAVYKIQLALQSGFVANLWQAMGSLLALCAVTAVVQSSGSVTWLVVAFVGTPLVVTVANNVWFFGVHRRDLRPQLKSFRRDLCGRVIREGGLFFVLQIAVALAFLSDNFVIAGTLGAKEVALYALCATLFSAIQIAMSILLTPLWPAYGDAIARADVGWIKKVLLSSIVAALIVPAVLSIPLVVWNAEILRLWTGEAFFAPSMLLAGFAVWRSIEAIGNATATFLNASNVIAQQVLLALVMSTFALVAKFYLVSEFGIAGAVWATIAAYLTITAVPQYWLVRKALIRMAQSRP